MEQIGLGRFIASIVIEALGAGLEKAKDIVEDEDVELNFSRRKAEEPEEEIATLEEELDEEEVDEDGEEEA